MGKISIQDLAAKLVEQNGLSKRDAVLFVNTMFDIVRQALDRDNMVKIKGLGTFKIVEVDARESVNVNTGERVLIDGHNKISFTPDTLMKELVNKPFSQFETVVLNEGVDFEEGQDLMEKEAMAAQAATEADAETAAIPLVDFGPADETSHFVQKTVEEENQGVEGTTDAEEEEVEEQSPVEDESVADEKSPVDEAKETDLGTKVMIDDEPVPDEIPEMDEKLKTPVMEEAVVKGEQVTEEPIVHDEEPIVLGGEPVVLGDKPVVLGGEPALEDKPAVEVIPATDEQNMAEEPTIADQLVAIDEPAGEEIPVVENPADEAKSGIEEHSEKETAVNVDSASDEDAKEEPESEVLDDDVEMGTPWYKRWLLPMIVGIVCLLIGYLCGYFLAFMHQDGSAEVQKTPVALETIDEISPAPELIEQAIVDDSTAVDAKVAENQEDSLASKVAPEVKETPKAEPVKESPEKESTPAPVKSTSAASVNSAAPAQAQPKLDQYEAKDARVRTGAYRIVGTDYMEKVREGDNLKRIARRTLGPDMECYIEVYNNLTSASPLKAGQQIKIPKLQLKKKKSTQK